MGIVCPCVRACVCLCVTTDTTGQQHPITDTTTNRMANKYNARAFGTHYTAHLCRPCRSANLSIYVICARKCTYVVICMAIDVWYMHMAQKRNCMCCVHATARLQFLCLFLWVAVARSGAVAATQSPNGLRESGIGFSRTCVCVGVSARARMCVYAFIIREENALLLCAQCPTGVLNASHLYLWAIYSSQQNAPFQMENAPARH